MNFSEWKESKLGDVCLKITKGTTPSTIGNDFTEKGINFYRSECLTESKYLDKAKVRYIDIETHEKMKRSQLQADDILFSMAGAFLGKTCIVKKEDIPANINQASALIRLDNRYADKDYIYYYLNQRAMVSYINNSSSQSAQPNINLKQIGELVIKLPSLKEQKAIANILSSLDEKIELNNQMNKTLEEIAQALFKRWFIDFEFPNEDGEPYKSSGGEMIDSELGMIPKGWEVKSLREIFTFRKGKKPEKIEDKKIDNMYKNYLTIDVLNRTGELYAIGEKLVESEVDDIMMVMDGASSGTIYTGMDGIVGSTLAKLEIVQKKLKGVIYQFLKYQEESLMFSY